jgi:malonyl-CoA/methylmalonyl-CoA synthetase
MEFMVVSSANLYDVLAAGFPNDREQLAIETPDRHYTWRDLEAASARIAGVFGSLNLPAGARIAVQVEKSPEALFLYLATLRAGYVYIPLNTAYRESEVQYFLENAEPSVVVCSTRNLAWVERIAQAAGGMNVFTLDDDGAGSLIDRASVFPPEFKTVERAEDDLAAILYTSGTTGRSKGAMLTHGNLSSNARVLHTYWGWSQDDVLLHMLPIFHVHGLFVAAHGALLAGARMIWLPKLDIEQALAHLPRCTIMMGVPTYYVRLLAEERFTKSLCGRMRLFVSGSAPLLADTFNAFQERTGHTILERYGMSETVMLTSNPYHMEMGTRIAGTVGRALPGVDVRIADDQGNILPVGEIGNIEVRGPNVFSGYWRMPEKTREEFTNDGWFKTGDVGCMGGHGLGGKLPDDTLSIVGRSKDLIISGGYNVYPKEVERVIDALPGVEESAVIGVPHPDFGEAVVAVVVPQAGAEISSGGMLNEIKNRIANFKVPKSIHVIDQLPRNAMGKVQKNLLRERYSGR